VRHNIEALSGALDGALGLDVGPDGKARARPELPSRHSPSLFAEHARALVAEWKANGGGIDWLLGQRDKLSATIEKLREFVFFCGFGFGRF